MEHLILYVWKHKLFPLKELRTTSGFPVEIIDSGSHSAGNEAVFFNAKLKIGGTFWVGNVEIYHRSSDWLRRGHDPGTNGCPVILLVATETDCEIKRTDGHPIPQLKLVCPAHVRQHYDELKASPIIPRCRRILGNLPRITVHSWLTVLQHERFEQKTGKISARLELCEGNWENAFFITLARNFGFGVNGDAFEQWSALLPFRILGKYRDNLLQIEAFFFGIAGLLEENPEDPYYRNLQKEYAYLRNVFDLKQMDSGSWNAGSQRPGNIPHLRIAQLARLYHTQHGLLSQIAEAKTISCAKNILRTCTSAYWETHYLFGRSSPRRSKPIGDKSLDLILINTVATFLYAYGKHRCDESLCERALAFLEELKPENNHITRMWHGAGIKAAHAADSQALIQLKKEYCDARRCLHCRFGYEYLKHQEKFQE